jgi:hypothetical protein
MPATRSRRRSVAALAVVVTTTLLTGAGADAAPGTTVRVSVRPGGAESMGTAQLPSMSSDGTAVLFSYTGSDLVEGVSGNHLYLARPSSSLVTLVTQRVAGSGGVGLTDGYYIDSDGSRVAFTSNSAGITTDQDTATCVEEDGGDEVHVNCYDVFVRDVLDGKTAKVSVDPNGGEADGHSDHARVSDDGRTVVFASLASNLAPGDQTGTWDIFVRQLSADDVDQGVTRRLTTTEPGSNTGEPVISADGTTVAFWSNSSTLDPSAPAGTNLFVYDLPAQTLSAVDLGPNESFGPTLSGNGRLLGFVSYTALVPEDTNPSYDLYVHDRQTGITELVNWDDDGNSSLNADRIEVSDDGTHALFRGGAGLLPDSQTPSGQAYVYVKDLATGAVRLASLAHDGTLLNAGADTGFRSLSPDGSAVVFWSPATNAVPNDTNGTWDVFLRVLGDDAPPPTEPGDLDETLDGSGDEVSTGAEATAAVPVVASIVPPIGVTGALTVDMQDSDPAAAPSGFSFFGTQLVIEGPVATVADPYIVTFTVDVSELTVAPEDVQVFRDGAPVADCTDPADAVPDPCVESRGDTADGDAVITVRTSHFSEWALGALDYALEGPYAPVDPFPTVNTVKAGSAVPVKFRLGGDRGLDVFADGYPDTEVVACGGSADAIEQTVAATGASLTYDTTTATYTYVWRSTKGATGCRDLVLHFRDGTELTARFQLR